MEELASLSVNEDEIEDELIIKIKQEEQSEVEDNDSNFM